METSRWLAIPGVCTRAHQQHLIPRARSEYRRQGCSHAVSHACAHRYPCIRRRQEEDNLLHCLGLYSWGRSRNTSARRCSHTVSSLRKMFFAISFSAGLLLPRAEAVRADQGRARVQLFCGDEVFSGWLECFLKLSLLPGLRPLMIWGWEGEEERDSPS